MSPQEPAETSPAQPLLAWDTEERNDLLPKEAHLRDTTLYLSAPLLEWMEQTWGGVASFVKTRTDEATGEVWVAKAREGEAGAVPLRRIGTQNSALFTFWRPLRKLNLNVPANRQFNLTPRLLKVDENLAVFVFDMTSRVSVPRNRAEEAAAEEAAAEVAAAAETPEAGETL